MKHFLILITSITLFSCTSNSNKTKNLENLDKKSAREVTLTTVTKNDTVYHLTKQTIWLNGEVISKKTDTIVTKLVENTWETDTTKIQKLNQIPIYVTVQ